MQLLHPKVQALTEMQNHFLMGGIVISFCIFILLALHIGRKNDNYPMGFFLSMVATFFISLIVNGLMLCLATLF